MGNRSGAGRGSRDWTQVVRGWREAGRGGRHACPCEAEVQGDAAPAAVLVLYGPVTSLSAPLTWSAGAIRVIKMEKQLWSHYSIWHVFIHHCQQSCSLFGETLSQVNQLRAEKGSPSRMFWTAARVEARGGRLCPCFPGLSSPGTTFKEPTPVSCGALPFN